MTTDLDVLMEFVDQPEPLTEAQIAIALGLLSGISARLPSLTYHQRRRHAAVCVAYLRHAAEQMPPARKVAYLAAARTIAEGVTYLETEGVYQ